MDQFSVSNRLWVHRCLALGVLLIAIAVIGLVGKSTAFADTYEPNGQWGSYGSSGQDKIVEPTSFAINDNGDVLVVDQHDNLIKRFQSDGTWLGSFGGEGTADGEFGGYIMDIAVNASGDIYVSDLDVPGGSDPIDCRIQKFGPTGDYLFSTSQCNLGGQLDVDEGGMVRMSDLPDQEVSALDSSTLLEDVSKNNGVIEPSVDNVIRAFDPDLHLQDSTELPEIHSFSSYPSGLATARGYDSNDLWDRPWYDKTNCVDWISSGNTKTKCWSNTGTSAVITALESGQGNTVFSGGVAGDGGIAKATKWDGAVAKNIGGNLQVIDLAVGPDGSIWALGGESGQGDLRISSYSPMDAGSTKIWPRKSGYIPQGEWGKIGGTIDDVSGDPMAGAGMFIQYRDLTPDPSSGSDPLEWKYFDTVYSNANGYYQKWFQAMESREYRAVYQGTNEVTSNILQMSVTYRIVAWNPHNSVTYGGWTRVHGLIKDKNGDPVSNAYVYLQVWDYAREEWRWYKGYGTTDTGYFDFWFRPYGTTHYRVFDWSSDAVSNTVTKTVSKRVMMRPTAWRMGFGDTNRITVEVQPRHPDSVVGIEWWDTAQQKWITIDNVTLGATSMGIYDWTPSTRGWHALRVLAPGDWDHEANGSRVHWIHVR